MGPQLASEFHLDAEHLGLLTGAYFFSFGLFQIPLGVLLDRYGPRRTDAALLLLAAVGTFVFASAHDFAGLFIGRMLIGLGVSAALMACFQAFVLWYPPERTGTMIALAYAVGGLGAMSVSVPLEFALRVVEWRTAVLVFAAASVVVSAWLFFAVPEKSSAPAKQLAFGVQLKQLLTIIRTDAGFRRLAIAIGTSQCAAVSTFTLWMGTWLRDVAGFDGVEVAVGLCAGGFGMVVGYLFFGRLADALVQRGYSVLPLFAAGVACGSACLLLLVCGVTTASVLTWSLFTLCSTGATLAHSIASRRYPLSLAGRINTTLNSCTFVGVFLGQWAVGAILTRWPPTATGYDPRGYTWGLGLLWAVQLFGLIWLWLGRAHVHRAPQS